MMLFPVMNANAGVEADGARAAVAVAAGIDVANDIVVREQGKACITAIAVAGSVEVTNNVVVDLHVGAEQAAVAVAR